MIRKVLVLSLAALSLVGCTHIQLRNNTREQMKTWSDIQYQQVADNLAMLAHNPEMLPYFIVIGQGTINVTDSVKLDGDLTWAPSARATRMLGLDLTHATKAQWQLRPITAPERLDWMRAAYLCALGDDEFCDGPRVDLENWYGLVTDAEAGFSSFGAHAGSEKQTDAIVVGRYAKTIVVVPENEMKALRLLTTLILEYATMKVVEVDAVTKTLRGQENYYNPNLGN